MKIKDAVYWIAEAWEKASSDSLRKAWRKLLHESVSEDMSTEDTCPDSSIAETIETAGSLGSETQEAIAEWMDADIDEPGHQVLDDEPGHQVLDDEPGHQVLDDEPGHQVLDDEPGHEVLDDEPGHQVLDDEPGHQVLDDEPGHQVLDDEPGHEVLDDDEM